MRSCRMMVYLWWGFLSWLTCVMTMAQTAKPGRVVDIEWDEKTLTLVQGGATYGRMIRLLDGSILCSYEAAGKSWVRHSRDEGKTWQNAVLVIELAYAAAANPELLQLKSGRILLFYNQRPRGGNHPFAIGYCISDDNGVTWNKPQHLIYTAANEFKDGCWEPAAIQLPSGEIQLFFANEFPYRHNNDQEITLVRSADNGNSWSPPETISYRAGHRDGMPVPLLLQDNNGIVLAIEDNGLAPGNQLQPAIIHTSLVANWKQPVVDAKSPYRWGAVIPPLAGNIYAGAPYIKQLPTGETILSCHSNEGGRAKPQMVVYIGDGEARNFQNRSVPFKIPNDVGGWWNSLFVKNAATVTAISATAINGIAGLWTIDGRVVRENEPVTHKP